jgi:hypothetical protein
MPTRASPARHLGSLHFAYDRHGGRARLLTLKAELDKRGIAFRIVEARSTVRDMLRTEGVEEKVGRIDRFTMLADAIDDFQNEPVTNHEPPK